MLAMNLCSRWSKRIAEQVQTRTQCRLGMAWPSPGGLALVRADQRTSVSHGHAQSRRALDVSKTSQFIRYGVRHLFSEEVEKFVKKSHFVEGRTQCQGSDPHCRKHAQDGEGIRYLGR